MTIIRNSFSNFKVGGAAILVGMLFLFTAATTASAFDSMSGSGNIGNHDTKIFQSLKGQILSQYKRGSKGLDKSHGKVNKLCTKVEGKDETLTAIELFRKYFHAGDYCKLPLLKDALMQEYLQTNGAFIQTQDPILKIKVAKITKIMGLAYLWTSAESERVSGGPSSLNEMITALFYFNTSYELNPDDTQTLGFLSNIQMAIGKIHSNQEMIEEGARLIALSIDRNPVFGLFGVAFGEVRAPVNSPVFQQGIEHFWTYQDICMQTAVDRNDPDWAPYVPIEGGENWICQNTENSLHRVEAFLLIFGDSLLKAGDLDAAEATYKNIGYITTAQDWKYKHIVKDRLKNLEAHYEALQTPDPSDDLVLIFNSKYKCSVCHEQ